MVETFRLDSAAQVGALELDAVALED